MSVGSVTKPLFQEELLAQIDVQLHWSKVYNTKGFSIFPLSPNSTKYTTTTLFLKKKKSLPYRRQHGMASNNESSEAGGRVDGWTRKLHAGKNLPSR